MWIGTNYEKKKAIEMIFGNDSQGENTIKLVHVSGLMDY
jgi:hypothetical protein